MRFKFRSTRNGNNNHYIGAYEKGTIYLTPDLNSALEVDGNSDLFELFSNKGYSSFSHGPSQFIFHRGNSYVTSVNLKSVYTCENFEKALKVDENSPIFYQLKNSGYLPVKYFLTKPSEKKVDRTLIFREV